MRIGTDTSFWAENVDYTKMVANGAEFTILRAGQGSWSDNYFQKNYDASEGMLPRSAYWFFDQRYKPSRQAELLAATLKDNPLEGYIWADYERDYEGAAYAKWEDFHTFLREIERFIPEMIGRIGIYTRYYYWKDHVPQDKWYLFENYPFWEARYEADAPFDKPFKCLLWQYSEKGDGLAYGLDPYVKKFVDLNYFMGTGEEWEDFTGSIIEIPPDPIVPPVELPAEIPETITGTVVEGLNLSVRAGAGTEFERYTVAPGGTVIPIDGIIEDGGDKWAKYKIDVYSAIKYKGRTYIELNGEVVKPPPPEPLEDGEYWRVLHDVELTARGIMDMTSRMAHRYPEVFLLEDINGETDLKKRYLGRSLQEMCFALLRVGAPSMDLATAKKKFRNVYGVDIAFTNNSGFDDNTTDYISDFNLDKNSLPALDKCRVVGGACLKGQVVGDRLKVETIRNALSIEYLLENPHLFFTALNSGDKPTDWGQGNGEPIFVPLIAPDHTDVYYPLHLLEKSVGIVSPYFTSV